MGFDEDGYWDPRELLSYCDKDLDIVYLMVLSDRGRGKSYKMKMKLMEWAEKGSTFMCIYRNATDLNNAVSEWIDPLVEQGWGPERFSWEGDRKGAVQLRFDGEVIGWFRTLTGANSVKQEHFPGTLNTVWFDEFIPLVYKKLAGVSSEGDALRTIVKTIDHDSVRTRKERGLRQLRVFMFGNPFTWDNSLLGYFKVNPCQGYGVHRVGPGVVCEMIAPLPRKGGRMTADDFLGDEVNRNEGWKNQLSFIAPLPKGALPTLSVRLGDTYFMVYTKGLLHWVVKTDGHKTTVNTYTGQPRKWKLGTHEGLREDELCLEESDTFRKMVKGMIFTGMRYPDINTKFEWIGKVSQL